uniref:(northern house mosquito) hypothetical protein n=1 Tax=Culex pipiens TaxID=7175 RepID=A0A8D8MJI5_CULPI
MMRSSRDRLAKSPLIFRIVTGPIMSTACTMSSTGMETSSREEVDAGGCSADWGRFTLKGAAGSSIFSCVGGGCVVSGNSSAKTVGSSLGMSSKMLGKSFHSPN